LRRYAELSSGQFRELANRAVFIVPVGSVEQHCEGPLGTDLMIAEAVSEAACEHLERSGTPCVLMPAIPYGLSAEWQGAPGTISVPFQHLVGLVQGIARSLVEGGARAVAFVNGHYGNSPAIQAALRDLMPSLPEGVRLLLVDYWEALDIDVGHASEAEREVLRALGYPCVSFGECERALPSPRGARVFSRPSPGPQRLNARAGQGLTRELIGAAVADAIMRALEESSMSRVLP